MNDIGIIGVGYIGSLFLDELLDAGYDVTVFDLDAEQVQAATERGASAADSPADLAREVDAVVVALPGSPEVEATMEGEAGLLESLTAGQVVVDATTTLPETSVACERLCRDRDVQFVEAPITGGSPRPNHHVMVGGTETAHDAAREVLDAVCDDHVRIGDVGDATVFKLALQLHYAGQKAVDAEVVEFCCDSGVDPAPLNEFLELGVWDRYFTGEYEQAIRGSAVSPSGTRTSATPARSPAKTTPHSRSRPSSTRRTRRRSAGSTRTGPRRGTHRVLAGTQRRREPRRAVVSPPTTRCDGWMEGCETIVCQAIARISGDRPVLADG